MTEVTGPIACGHPGVSPDGETVACAMAVSGEILARRWNGSDWGDLEPLFPPGSPADLAAVHAPFAECDSVAYGDFEWCGDNDLLVASVRCFEDREANVVSFGRVLLLELAGAGRPPRMTDLTAELERHLDETGLSSTSASCHPYW